MELEIRRAKAQLSHFTRAPACNKTTLLLQVYACTMGVSSSCFGSDVLHVLKSTTTPGAPPGAQPGVLYESHGYGEQVLFFPDLAKPCKDFLHGVRYLIQTVPIQAPGEAIN